MQYEFSYFIYHILENCPPKIGQREISTAPWTYFLLVQVLWKDFGRLGIYLFLILIIYVKGFPKKNIDQTEQCSWPTQWW